VNRDNTVSFQNLSLQIERVRWRATLAGCQVVVHQHLDGTLSLTHGPPNGAEVPDDRIKEPMQHCIVVVYAVERVGGRIRYIGEMASEREPRRLWRLLKKKTISTTPVALEPESEPPMETDNG
jgi:hypothetical protein